MALTAIEKITELTSLDAWGYITNISGKLVDQTEDIEIFGKMTFGAPNDPISAGYFATKKGKYQLVYSFSEQAILLAGEITITDEVTGHCTTYKPGDFWVVEKGTSTIWQIKSEYFIKHYFAVV
ncbi:cupin domain-containing protein [Acinetobacter puyangensis]|uniref:(S)-ureidoglycine aminohydrolase cupin domain-containing protein n=1 Tax=Acinetobacter puyangensis TaxID=1096779 RepID=A0A240EED6_9GAMM|nr:cupin domain-containing protein [Acinetobacter puyangensis]SNX46305.1 hypothetical protein SAMN05421731_11052 [Acinetobacter puyangensis]